MSLIGFDCEQLEERDDEDGELEQRAGGGKLSPCSAHVDRFIRSRPSLCL